MNIALFSVSEKVEGFHRLPFLKQINHQLEKQSGQLVYFKRPRFWLFANREYRSSSEVDGISSKPLYTFAPISLVIGNKFLRWLFLTLPIKHQVKRAFKASNGVQHINWFYKPDQYLYLNGLKAPYVYTHYDNYDDDAQYYFSAFASYQDTLQSCVKGSLASFATGQKLVEKLQSYGGKNQVRYLPNAVSAEWLFQGSGAEKRGKDVVIGFVGSIDDSIDESLVAQVCKRFPTATIRLIGEVNNTAFVQLAQEHSNLELIGRISYQNLPRLVSQFSVGLVPYKDSPFNQYRNPLKLYEYCARGIPSVSVKCDFDSVGQKYVNIAENYAHFLESIESTLKSKDDTYQQRISFAAQNTWSIRARQAITHIEEALNEKRV